MKSVLIANALIFSIVPIILGLVYVKTQTAHLSSNVIKFPRFFLWIGIVGTLLATILMIGTILRNFGENLASDIFVLIAGPIFIFLGFLCISYSVSWKLVFEDDIIIHRNLFFITRKYEYSEIKAIYAIYNKRLDRLEKYRVCTQKRSFTVECLALNFDRFEYLMKKGLRKHKNKISIQIK